MSEDKNEGDDGRMLAVAIFFKAAITARTLATLVPEPAKTALKVGAALADVVAEWVETMGVDGALETIKELQRRKNEGAISNAAIAVDNARIAKDVADMFDLESNG